MARNVPAATPPPTSLFKDKDGNSYERLRVRPSDLKAIRNVLRAKEAAHEAMLVATESNQQPLQDEINTITDQAAKEIRAFTPDERARIKHLQEEIKNLEPSEEEQDQYSLLAKVKAYYGPYCPNVDFDDLDVRQLNQFADAFWSHLNGNDPN
jgi:hypothetical protein